MMRNAGILFAYAVVTFAIGFGAAVWLLNNVTLHVVVDRIDSIDLLRRPPR